MAAQYTLKILTDFASAHTLRDYPGDCSRMHGHNWKVEVEVIAQQLDDAGMGLDFKVIKEAARALAKRLDHRYLNDIEPFDKVNPTAENIAAYFYQGLSQRLNNPRVRVSAVTLWETERACVRYSDVQGRTSVAGGRMPGATDVQGRAIAKGSTSVAGGRMPGTTDEVVEEIPSRRARAREDTAV